LVLPRWLDRLLPHLDIEGRNLRLPAAPADLPSPVPAGR
jgi:hypothetical protein